MPIVLIYEMLRASAWHLDIWALAPWTEPRVQESVRRDLRWRSRKSDQGVEALTLSKAGGLRLSKHSLARVFAIHRDAALDGGGEAGIRTLDMREPI